MSTAITRPVRVFLCHASDDKPLVRLLYKKLIQDGIDVWLDEEKLIPGQEWNVEIAKAVRQSDIVIICLSKKSTTKEGYVQKEIRIALDVAEEKPEETIYIIPVRLEECDVPARLKRWQWTNLYSISGIIDDIEYKRLLEALKLRSTQLGMSFPINKPAQVSYQFEPNSFAISPPRAWIFPDANKLLLPSVIAPVDEKEIMLQRELIQNALGTLNLPVFISQIDRGPRFTRFSADPLYRETEHGNVKVRVSEFEKISDDLALALGLKNIAIQAPIPGHNLVGIETHNAQVSTVSMLEVYESKDFNRQNQFNLIFGRDVAGLPVVVDLLSLPCVLVAGRPRSGKSVFIDALISCLMIENSPNELQFVFIDTRRVEYSIYQNSPHLLSPILVEEQEIIGAFKWIIREMEDRQKLFARKGVRTIGEYNEVAEFDEKIPVIVIVVSELFDLLSGTSGKKQLEMSIARLTSLARVSGIQVFLSTQHPSLEILTPRIKANITNRVAFATFSAADSEVIIDRPGAERLLGEGDMWYLNSVKPLLKRVQGPLISQEEISRLVDFWGQQLI